MLRRLLATTAVADRAMRREIAGIESLTCAAEGGRRSLAVSVCAANLDSMAPPVKAETLRGMIAETLAEWKSYELPALCEHLGLAPGTEDEAFASKFRYVMARLRPLSLPQLVAVAQRFLDEHDDAKLEQALVCLGAGGVDGEFKNLIFAAVGPKPEIVLRSAINNDLQIVRNADNCLVYSRSLKAEGLTWRDLTSWWRSTVPELHDADEVRVSQHLYRRLKASMESPPEHLLFDVYCSFYPQPGGDDLPALIPQVYLHYDLALRPPPSRPGPLRRQRMDFLLLLPHRNRVVIEVDGVQHYSRLAADAPPPDSPGYFEMDPQIRRPDTRKYSEMVSEDRNLRLEGYEVYRFGGGELTAPGGKRVLADFFGRLFARHNIAFSRSA
ncbi:hypothetical protein AB0D67_30555 [Streptosporangium sp. NPDC048047]|uniref:hypothetical protein n=1 Tax=Streptosporangium sp. NPDC048047 TaxID=3155748 RepID=UPI00343AFCDA